MYVQVVPKVSQVEEAAPSPSPQSQEPAAESFASILGEVSAPEPSGEAPLDQDAVPPDEDGATSDPGAETQTETELDALVTVMVMFQGEAAETAPPTLEGTDAASAEVPGSSAAVSQARYTVLPAEARAGAQADGDEASHALSLVTDAGTEASEQGGLAEVLDTPEESSELTLAKGRALVGRPVQTDSLAQVVAHRAVAPAGPEDSRLLEKPKDPGLDTKSVPVPRAVVRTTQVVQDPRGTTIIERVSVDALPEYTVKNVRHLVTAGRNTVTVRLVPESLGEMHLKVTSARGALSVRLVSANPVVRETLEAQLPGLREALARDGIDVARVTVSADMGPGYQAPDGSNRQPAQFGRAQWSEAAFTGGSAGGEPSSGRESVLTVQRHDGALNVFA